MKKQLSLKIYKGQRGGRRPGSGRKRIKSVGVAHRLRENVTSKTPLHINFKYRSMIKNKQSLKLLKKAIINARSHGLKIIHFSMQSNHMHFIIEAPSNEVLSRGMRSLTVTFAKGLKKGRVQVERYHLHVLRTLKETKNAVLYVLFNKQKHEKGTYSTIDEFTSLTYMKNPHSVIREFCKFNKRSLKFKKNDEVYVLDSGGSYLLSKSLS